MKDQETNAYRQPLTGKTPEQVTEIINAWLVDDDIYANGVNYALVKNLGLWIDERNRPRKESLSNIALALTTIPLAIYGAIDIVFNLVFLLTR